MYELKMSIYVFLWENFIYVQIQDMKLVHFLGTLVLLQFLQQLTMPLEISAEVFKWLQGQSLVKEAKRNQNNLMEVNQEQANKLMDGFVLNVIFRNAFKDKLNQQKMKKLDALKDNSTPAIRLYNWGILSDMLKHLGYNIEYTDKSKITNYDSQPLSKVFTFLFGLKAKDPNTKQVVDQGLKIDINQISKKTIKDVTNALQFLTLSISKNFKISPQQTLNLFLDNNKYLSHLLAKGVKNSFQPVYSLLNQLKQNVEFIVTRLFCLDQQLNISFLFNALRSCFISKDQNVAKLFCQFVLDVYDQYMLGIINLQFLRKWFKDQGINTLFFSIKKHPLLLNLIITISYNILDDEFFKYIQLSQKSILWISQKQRLLFYKNFVQETSKEVLQKFSVTNYFEEWNRLFIKTMKKTKDNSQILILIAIMEQQWGKLNQKFQQSDQGLPNIYINFLKNVVSLPNQLIFVQASRTLFSLMQTLGTLKNPFAPLIYKILVSEYKNSNDIAKIVYMSENFIFSFKGITSLPGGPLVQPLLKHLQLNKDYSVIELATIMVQQKRVEEQQSLELIEMMMKIIFTDVIFGTFVLDNLFLCLESLSQQNSQGFLQNNSKASLAQLFSISKSLTKSIKLLKQQNEKMKDQQSSNKTVQSFINNVSKHILCKNIVGFLSKSLFIQNSLQRELQPSVFHTYIKIKVELKKTEQAQLLKPILVNYYEEEQELEQKIQYYMKIAYPPKPQPSEKLKGHGHSHSHLSKSVILRPNTTQNSIQKQQTILDPASLKPTSFAIKDLQKVKQKRYELKTIQVQKQKQKALKQQKIQKFRTIQYEKRLVQSMTTIKNDVQYKHLQQNQQKPISTQPQVHQVKQANVPYIRIVNLDKQEEQSYKEDAQSVLRRYKKVWRYLFFKYSIKKTESGGEEKAHMGDVWKMLKDYDFNFLKKQQSNTIVRLINQNLKRKNEIQFLNYQAFEDFVMQASIIGYGKAGFSHIPPGQQLLKFIDQLKKVTKEKSGNIDIFQNPQEAYFQQTDVIRQFNKRLKQNPDYILPEGYKRIKETSLQYQYQFHPMLQKNISNSYAQCYQVLDSILSKHPKLGFHIIQPMTIKLQTYLAKPFLFQSISQKMKEYTKGYLQPKRTISASVSKDTINFPSPVAKKQIKPYINFSIGIKLGIAQTSLKNKSIAQEVAYCMQDILNAIENNSTTVKKGNRRKITNQVMRKKKFQLAKLQNDKKKEEINWKKRAQSVKLQVEILRQKRKESQKKKKKQDFLQRKKKKQREEKYFKQKMAEFQKAKAKIAEKKQALLQLKAAQEEKIKKEKQQYRIGVSQYFRKKKQEIKEKQQQYKRKKAEQKEKKQQVEQSKKQFAKKLYLSNLKKEQEVLQKVDEIKQNYDDVWKSTQIQEVFTQHKTALKLLFDLLLKYQKSKISATNYDEIGLATLNFFCLRFRIIPFMLQKQDINKIFVFATKNDQQKKTNRKGINFQKFQEVIFLISTKAKKTLNKIVEKRKKKEKKMQAFLNAKKSNDGNHYEADEVQQSSSEQQSDDQKPTLQDQYLFNTENVSQQTVGQVFSFLKLPNSKPQMEQRYKQAMQAKTSKPKNLLLKEIKQSIQE